MNPEAPLGKVIGETLLFSLAVLCLYLFLFSG